MRGWKIVGEVRDCLDSFLKNGIFEVVFLLFI